MCCLLDCCNVFFFILLIDIIIVAIIIIIIHFTIRFVSLTMIIVGRAIIVLMSIISRADNEESRLVIFIITFFLFRLIDIHYIIISILLLHPIATIIIIICSVRVD